jgi:hypothetical protein
VGAIRGWVDSDVHDVVVEEFQKLLGGLKKWIAHASEGVDFDMTNRHHHWRRRRYIILTRSPIGTVSSL